jgi:hypothetical protein
VSRHSQEKEGCEEEGEEERETLNQNWFRMFEG